MVGHIERSWCLLLTLFLFSFSLTLEEAERKALENSTDVRIEEIELSKRSLEVKERFGEMLPRVDLDLSLNLSRRLSFTLPSLPPLPPQEFTFQRDVYPKATLLVRQDILNLTTRRRYEVSKIMRRAQAYQIQEKRLETIYRVREAYINALKARAAMTVYRQQMRRVASHLKDVENLYREGVVAFKDVLETKVRIHEVRERYISAEADYNKALQYLSYLVGEKVETVEDVGLETIRDLSTYPEEVLVERLRSERPILKFLREVIRAREKGLELARSYFYPVLVAEGFLQYTEESDIFPKTRYLVSLALRWNLFSGLRRFRSVEIADLVRRQDLERLRDLERRLLLEMRNLLEDIRSARERVKLAEARVEEAKEHLRIAVEKYRAGLGTNTEVLDAESYLTQAQQTLRINTYDLMLKLFKLQRVVGHEE